MANYAGVIVDISLEKLDRVFDYKIPPHLEEVIKPGVPVWIPFGMGNRRIKGFVVNVSDQCAHVKITLLYVDKAPVSFTAAVEAMRVRCLRTNEEKDFGPYTAVEGEQYAIMLESDQPIVAQYGRAEPRTVNFYTTPGYCE